MALAARVFDQTNHGGFVIGPGALSVLIGGMPAAVMTDMHSCGLPPDTHPLTASPFTQGSATVFIEGKPALRVGDACLCGATPLLGEPTVEIG